MGRIVCALSSDSCLSSSIVVRSRAARRFNYGVMVSYLEADQYLATWRRIYLLQSHRPNYPFAPLVAVAQNPWAESSQQSSLVLSVLIPPSKRQPVTGVALLPAA